MFDIVALIPKLKEKVGHWRGIPISQGLGGVYGANRLNHSKKTRKEKKKWKIGHRWENVFWVLNFDEWFITYAYLVICCNLNV